MRIIAHRGYWSDKQDQNTYKALIEAINKGYGIETDLWATEYGALISHDAPDMERSINFEEGILKSSHASSNPIMALNVKSSDLESVLPKLPSNCFLFDASVPDMIKLMKAGHKVFTRMSEYERNPVLAEQASGVWLDMFESDWMNDSDLRLLQAIGKDVVIVSPELHGRAHVEFWNKLKYWGSERVLDLNKVMLCTDFPDEANEVFNGT